MPAPINRWSASAGSSCWRWSPRGAASRVTRKKARIGFDYVHSVVDDHSRFAYSEILPDERGATTAAFFARALERFAEHHITVQALMTDTAWN